MTLLERVELEGLQKGRQEGRQEGQAELVLNFLKAGLSKEIICEVAGLSQDELERLLVKVKH